MKMEKIQPISQFAVALREILDKTGLFSRSEWADLLSIREAAISQWLHDKTLPRPEILRMILRTIYESDHQSPSAVQKFWNVASRPAEEVTPLTVRSSRSIADYIIVPIGEAFQRALAHLSPGEQETILRIATLLCHHKLWDSVMFNDAAVTQMDAVFSKLATLPNDERATVIEQFLNRSRESFQSQTREESNVTIADSVVKHNRRAKSNGQRPGPSRSGDLEESNLIVLDFAMQDGSIALLDDRGTVVAKNQEEHQKVSKIIQYCRAVARGPSQKAPSLAAADALRSNHAHFDPQSTNGYLYSELDELTDRAAYAKRAANGFAATVVVIPQKERYEVELLLEDKGGVPLNKATVSWRLNGREPNKISIPTGGARITSCRGGTLELAVKVPRRPLAKIFVRLADAGAKHSQKANDLKGD